MKKQKPSEDDTGQQDDDASGPLHAQVENYLVQSGDLPSRAGNRHDSATRETRNTHGQPSCQPNTDQSSIAEAEYEDEGIEQWEQNHKREASRLSSMRCQQRKRRRVDNLEESQNRLELLNRKLSEQNENLRTAIAAVRQVVQAADQNRRSMAFSSTALQGNSFYPQGNLSNGQPPALKTVLGQNLSQEQIQPGLDLAFILNASMNQRTGGGGNQWLPSGLPGPIYNTQVQVGMLPSSVFPGNTNPSLRLNTPHSSLSVLQNYLNMSQQHAVANNQQGINQLTQLQAFLRRGNNLGAQQSNTSTVTAWDGGNGNTDRHDEDPSSVLPDNTNPTLRLNTLQSSLAVLQNYLNMSQQHSVANNQQGINQLTQLQAFLRRGNNLGAQQSNTSTVTASDGGNGNIDRHDEDRDSTRANSNQSDESRVI
jgi:hypothetical protein